MVKVNKKALIASALLLLGAGKSTQAKQIQSEPKRVVKENVADTTKREDTGTVALDAVAPMQSNVKISNVRQSLYAEAMAFTYATPENFRLVWAPLFVIQPTMTIDDKLVVGFTTTQMFQNYASDKLTPTIHDIYTHAKMKIGTGEVFAKLGNFSALNYAGEFSANMPVSYFFQNAVYMQSGHYLPMAAIGGVRGKHFSLGAGYASHEHRLQFAPNGDIILVGELLLNKVKFGTLWMVGPTKSIGDLQMIYNSGANSALLLEFIGVNTEKFGAHAAYTYKIIDDQALLLVNGYWQNGGIAGWHLGGRHIASGIYGSFGFTYNDPLLKGTAKYDDVSPVLELGIKKDIFSLFNPAKTK